MVFLGVEEVIGLRFVLEFGELKELARLQVFGEHAAAAGVGVERHVDYGAAVLVPVPGVTGIGRQIDQHLHYLVDLFDRLEIGVAVYQRVGNLGDHEALLDLPSRIRHALGKAQQLAIDRAFALEGDEEVAGVH